MGIFIKNEEDTDDDLAPSKLLICKFNFLNPNFQLINIIANRYKSDSNHKFE